MDRLAGSGGGNAPKGGTAMAAGPVYNWAGEEIGGYTRTWHRRRGEGRLECWINVRHGAMTLERVGTCNTEAEAIAMVEQAWDAYCERQAA